MKRHKLSRKDDFATAAAKMTHRAASLQRWRYGRQAAQVRFVAGLAAALDAMTRRKP